MVHDQDELQPEAGVQPHELTQVGEEKIQEETDQLQSFRSSTRIGKAPTNWINTSSVGILNRTERSERTKNYEIRLLLSYQEQTDLKMF